MSKQAHPASPSSRSSRTVRPAIQGAAKHRLKTGSESRQPKRPRARKFTRVVLVRLVEELSKHNPTLYTELRRNVALSKAREEKCLPELVKKVAAGTALGPQLVGYDCSVLDIAEAIVRFIWHPQPKAPKGPPPPKDSKRVLTDAQQAQRQRDLDKAASQPAMTPCASSYTTPKGAPKTVPRRKTVDDDATIVERALRELLEEEEELKQLLRGAKSKVQLRSLLWDEERKVVELAERLKEEVNAPSRLTKCLEAAATRILNGYRLEDEAQAQAEAARKAARRPRPASTT